MAATTTLTLNIEENLLQQAKRHAERHGLTLAALVETLLLGLAREEQAPQPAGIGADLGEILDQLRRLQTYCGEPAAARHASKLLHSMRAFRDHAEDDPHVEVVMALYDAMAFEDNWLSFTRTQYQGAHDIIAELSRHRTLSEEDVEKAINVLEDLGFDTTPFGMDTAQEVE